MPFDSKEWKLVEKHYPLLQGEVAALRATIVANMKPTGLPGHTCIGYGVGKERSITCSVCAEFYGT